jgi:hypothetical protein
VGERTRIFHAEVERRQLSLRYDRSISWRTATIGAWLPRIEIAAAPA